MNTSTQTQPYIEETEPITRREAVLHGVRQVARVGSVALAAGLLEEGMQLPHSPVNALESDGVRLVLGNHLNTVATSGAKERQFRMNGDLNCSLWNNAPLVIIDQNMRTAKQMDKPYFCVLDSLGTIESSLDWTLIPHPDLSRRADYPDPIYLVGAEVPNDLGIAVLGEYDIPTHKRGVRRQFDALVAEVSGWFDTYSSWALSAENRQSTYDNFKDSSEAILAMALALSALNSSEKVGRRAALKSIATIVGIATLGSAKLNSQLNGFGINAGNSSSEAGQEFWAAAAGVAKQGQGDSRLDQWLQFRTAIAVEKAHDMADVWDIKPESDNINLLYGSGHNIDATDLLDSQVHRLDVVDATVRQLLNRVDETLKGKYPALVPFREIILGQVAWRTIETTIYEIDFPWGMHHVAPSQIDKFEKSLIRDKVTLYCLSMMNVVDKILLELGVKAPPDVIKSLLNARERLKRYHATKNRAV